MPAKRKNFEKDTDSESDDEDLLSIMYHQLQAMEIKENTRTNENI